MFSYTDELLHQIKAAIEQNDAIKLDIAHTVALLRLKFEVLLAAGRIN